MEDAAHVADGDICGAAHDADYDVGVVHNSDGRHGIEGNNSTGDASDARKDQVSDRGTRNFGAAHDANGYQEGPGKRIALLKEGSRAQIRTTGHRHVDTASPLVGFIVCHPPLRGGMTEALWLGMSVVGL